MRFIWILSVLVPTLVLAQDRCGVNASYFDKRPESTETFENWLGALKVKRRLQSKFAEESIYAIPVVFHIIHAGEPLGTGSNVPDEKVLEQLQILNEDYRKLNADTINIPSIFLPVSADAGIEFVLAKRDPEGLPTTGIIRKQGSQPGYNLNNINDNITLKAESYWPAEEYLNIYVTEMTAGLIGWGQFPFSSLEGIKDIEPNRLTDGVVIDYQYFGINPDASSFPSFGRTATHEIGHFLGLRHVWGDVFNCSGNDYCEDTPTQSKSYADTCPDTPQFSCDSEDMYSNFLNYTDDGCMNLFTSDQKERMRLILENAPRRTTLLNSPALNAPIQVADDLGIRRIVEPAISGCTSNISPVVEVRNYGTNSISAFSLRLSVNGADIETITKEINLSPLETTIVNFTHTLALTDPENDMVFTVDAVNGSADNNHENNTASIRITNTNPEVIPYALGFESIPNTTSRTESGIASAWSISAAPYITGSNQAASIDLSNITNPGEFDYLITPVFDLSSLTSAELNFSYAYSGDGGEWNKDGFIVAVSTDCGENFLRDNYLFEKYGASLATTTPRTTTFVPGFPDDWSRESINLTAFTGHEDVRIAFIGVNSGGNMLYLDSIEVMSAGLKAYDLGIKSLSNIPAVTCSNTILPSFEIRNYGFEVINSFNLDYSIESVTNAVSETDLSLTSGQTHDLQFPITNLNEGTYDILFRVKDPNNQTDEESFNDTINYRIVVDNTQEELPLREDFEDENSWIITNTSSSTILSLVQIENNTAVRANAFENATLGTRHWLVSPVLIPEPFDSLGVFFKYAYRSRVGATDRLQVYLSLNCGDSFEYLLYEKTSAELNPETSGSAYIPANEDEWVEEFIDLSEFTDWNDVRLAWVFTNGNGNNLYIDDIEFVNSGNQNLPRSENQLTVYPNPAADQEFNVVLNLNQKEDVNISLVDVTGKIIFSKDFPNALNQALSFATPAQNGFYFLRVLGKKINQSRRIYIRR